MSKEYDAYTRLEGEKLFDAWARLGGTVEVIWMRKLANGVGHASLGKKLHAFTTSMDTGISFCRKYDGMSCIEFPGDELTEGDACTMCWAMFRTRWEHGSYG